MFKRIILACLLLSFISPLQAGIDKEFGEKITWWKTNYNQFLSYFGIEKNYALVIGVGKYKDSSFQSLPSEKDAIRIKDYLINEAGFDHVRLITGDQVNVHKIRKLMFDYYPSILSSKDRFLFYWSGHGVTKNGRRKQGYLAVQDSQVRSVSSMVSMSDLAQWDHRMKAKQTLYLLDACFSGMAASKAMSINQDQTIDRITRPSSQVLTAGLGNEQTIVISDINGGVFTRALLDGLRGHADTDKGPFKKDGVVTARELEAYVRTRVDHERRRVHWGKPITPVLYNFSRYEGDFFFISDKSVLKKPLALKKGRPAKIVGTGVKIQPKSFKRPRTVIRKKKIGHYIDNGDGTVRDTRTGLMWKKCAEGQRGLGCAGIATKFTWKELMVEFRHIKYAGYSDWRLPSIQELHTLVECGNKVTEKEAFKYSCNGRETDNPDDLISIGLSKKPTINSSIFPDVMAEAYRVCSSTPNQYGYGWFVSFLIGGAYDDTGKYKPLGSNQLYCSVRLVRQ